MFETKVNSIVLIILLCVHSVRRYKYSNSGNSIIQSGSLHESLLSRCWVRRFRANYVQRIYWL